jgi:16S rRNA (guanine1516-N2)-methyltransferase
MKLLFAASERNLVDRWGDYFELVSEPDCPIDPDEFYLRFTRDQLALCRGTDRRGVRVDDSETRNRLRGKFALGQACGNPRAGLTVLDATAGLGTDLLSLYARGYQVSACERNPVLWALLDSYLFARGIVDIDLRLVDAVNAMADQRAAVFDVIYLDPMFPEHRKKALPGKAMQYLRDLLPAQEQHVGLLLESARQVAADRVVLKRRRRDATVGNPDWQVMGSTVRYDVYRPCA